MKLQLLSLAAACAVAGPLAASEVNTAALSQNGWFSDDTRADGTGSQTGNTNLKSLTLTALPEQAMGLMAHDADILSQIQFGVAPGTVPFMTHAGAVRLRIASPSVPGGTGKTTISHRKDDVTGHGPGSAFGPGFSATYSWRGDSTAATLTAALKIGIKTAEFGSAPVSGRTGENTWDKLLVYEPYNNSSFSDGLWHVESTTHTSGVWWLVDRTAPGNTMSTPMTLSAMPGSPVTIGASMKTVAMAWAAIVAPGSVITSIQFGVGSGNDGADVYVNQLETSFYRSGDVTTFGTPSPYDQNVTPDVIFGGGNINGSYTVDRQDGVELGMRGKLRFPPSNIFNSNGDGTYTFNTGTGGAAFPNAEWAFEWSINTNWNGSSSYLLDDLSYEIGMDFDPGAGTNYLKFDQITPGAIVPFVPPVATVFWDHSIGTNATLNGGGTEAVDAAGYIALLAGNNVAQNSWRPAFFIPPIAPTSPFTFNPNVNGRYEFYLSAFDGAARVAHTAITIFALDQVTLSLEGDACQTTDQDPVTPGIQIEVKLQLRNPDSEDITGYQAFLDFDESTMTYVGATSSYSASPFGAHIQPIATAEVTPGKLRLDGSTVPLAPALDDDALLATLYFTVSSCVGSSVTFDLGQPFPSVASFVGVPFVTDLLNSPTIVSDTVAPVIGAHANITQPADAGSCTQAVVIYAAPSVTDNCDVSPTLVCSPPSGSVFPVGTTTVTCTATDDCGNQSMSTFDVTITPTNAIDVVVHLEGSGPTSRCIHFQTNTCSADTDVTLTFSGTAPSIAMATIEVPCGVWTSLCAKDQQHSQWDTSALTNAGSKYIATMPLVLEAGDTDNDGDVDINDVTWFVAQFGTLADYGGCPWDLVTRDADFSNNGAIGSEDYSLLTVNWLTTSSCACAMPLVRGDDPREPEVWTWVRDAQTAAADLNADGRVDVRDVEELEQRHGLSGELSRRMREKQR